MEAVINSPSLPLILIEGKKNATDSYKRVVSFLKGSLMILILSLGYLRLILIAYLEGCGRFEQVLQF